MWLFLLLVVFVGVALWALGGSITYQQLQSQDGIWDLRYTDFQRDSVRLSGSVEYVEDALLTPKEFAESENIVIGDVPESGLGCVTSRIRLLVPDDNFYEIAGFADDFGSRIYVNGQHLVDIGMPGKTKEDNVPAERFLTFTAEAQDGIIEIVQQSSNLLYRYNTSHIRWTVGRYINVSSWAESYVNSYVTIMGIYIALFLVHMLLFLVMRSYRANLWFGLLCLVWAVRTGITSLKPLLVLAPWISWEASFRMEYLSVLSALVLITLAYNLIFPDVLSKAMRYTAYISMSLFALLYLFADTFFMSQTMIFYEIITIFCATWAIVCIAKKVRNTDMKQRIIIISLFLILIALVIDTLYYNGLLPFIRNAVTEITILIFSMFQMTAMFLGTMEEVTSAKANEQKLAIENAALEGVNRMKNDMMATISHEMRTPLAVLSGYSELISRELRQKGVDEQTACDLDKISVETQRLAGIMEEMQSISGRRERSSRKAPLQLEAIIRQIARMYEHMLKRKDTCLFVEINEELPVFANADEMTQVMFNLLSNAAKHTSNGKISICAKKEADVIAVSVSDDGDGIAPELLPHVFERYRHGDGEGNGLGLYITKEIVEAHDGKINIESSVGSGTTVSFFLPAYEEARE